MKCVLKLLVTIVPLIFLFVSTSVSSEVIRVFTWEGYVLPHEVTAVNLLLKQKGYGDFTVEVISPWAEGPEHMFKVLRAGKADVSFLTLNYIKMQNDKIAKLLQPIKTSSPRLSNFSKLSSALTEIPMAMRGKEPLYLPWGGGAYGIWANMDKLKEADLPTSVKGLWDKKWKGKLALSKGQVQPNVALASLAMGREPFYINDMAADRSALSEESRQDSKIQKKMNQLYGQVSQFWAGGPDFKDPNVLLVASYGIAASAINRDGGNWKLINFEEGNTAWLDTINFHKDVTGRKLEATEVFANYFIGKEVQNRLVNGLGMVAASSLAESNPLIDENPDFFSVKMFWPPYQKAADNVMLIVSDRAMK